MEGGAAFAHKHCEVGSLYSRRPDGSSVLVPARIHPICLLFCVFDVVPGTYSPALASPGSGTSRLRPRVQHYLGSRRGDGTGDKDHVSVRCQCEK